MHLYDSSNFIVFTDSIDGKYSFHKEDNLLYVEMITPMWFDAGKKACQDIPGHRLMIIKTEVQYEYFQSLWETHSKYRYYNQTQAFGQSWLDEKGAEGCMIQSCNITI